MSSDGSDSIVMPGALQGIEPDEFHPEADGTFDGGSLPTIQAERAELEELRQELLDNNQEFRASLVAFLSLLRCPLPQQLAQQQQRTNEAFQQAEVDQVQGQRQQRILSPEVARLLGAQQVIVPGGQVEQRLLQDLELLTGMQQVSPQMQVALQAYLSDLSRFMEGERSEVQNGIPRSDWPERDEVFVELLDDFISIHIDPALATDVPNPADQQAIRTALAQYVLEARESLVYQQAPPGNPGLQDPINPLPGPNAPIDPAAIIGDPGQLYPIPEIADILERLQPNQFVTMPETDAMARHLLPFAQQQGYTIELGQLRTGMHWIAHQYEGYNGEIDREQLEQFVGQQFAQYRQQPGVGSDQFQELVVDLIVRINAVQRGIEPPPAPVLPQGFSVDETSERVADLDALRDQLEHLGTQIANARYDEDQEEVARLTEQYNSLLYDNYEIIPEEEYASLQQLFMEAEERETEAIPVRLEMQRQALLTRLEEEAQGYALDVAEGRVPRSNDHTAALRQGIEEALGEDAYEEAARRIDGIIEELLEEAESDFEAALSILDAETQQAVDDLEDLLRPAAIADANARFQIGETTLSSEDLGSALIQNFDRLELLRSRVPDLDQRLQQTVQEAFQERLATLQQRDQELQIRIPAELLTLARREGELRALLEDDTIPGDPDRALVDLLGEGVRERLQAELDELLERRHVLLHPDEGGPYTGEEAEQRTELIAYYERHPESLQEGDEGFQHLYTQEQEQSFVASQQMGVPEGMAIPGYVQMADQLINLINNDPEPTESQLLVTLYRLRLGPEMRTLVNQAYETRMGESLDDALGRIVRSDEGQETLASMRTGTYDQAVFRSIVDAYGTIPNAAARNVELIQMLGGMSPEQLAVLDLELQNSEPSLTLEGLIEEAGGEEVAAWLTAYRSRSNEVQRAIEIHLLLATTPSNEASVLLMFQAAGIDDGRAIAEAFEERYDLSLASYIAAEGSTGAPRVSATSRPYISAVLSGNQERVDTEGLVLALGFRSPREAQSLDLQTLFDHLQSLPEERRAEAVANVQRFISVNSEHFFQGIPFTDDEREVLNALNGGSLRDYLYLQAGRNVERTEQLLHVLGIEGEAAATQEDIDGYQRVAVESQQHMAQIVQAVTQYEGDELLLRLYQLNLSEDQFEAAIAQFRALNNEDLLRSLQLAAGDDNQQALQRLLSGNRVSFARNELQGLLQHLSDNPLHHHHLMHSVQEVASFFNLDRYTGTGNLPIDRGFELIAGLSREELQTLSRSMVLNETLEVIGGPQLATMARMTIEGNEVEAHARYLAFIIHAPGSSGVRGQRIVDFLRSIPADEREGLLQAYAAIVGTEASVSALLESTSRLSHVREEHLPIIRAYLEGDAAEVQQVELFSLAGLYGGQPDFLTLNAMLQSTLPADRMRMYQQMEAYAEEHIESILEELDPPLTEAQQAAMNAMDRGALGQLMFVRNGRNAYHATQTLRLFGARPGEGPLSTQELQLYSARMAAASRFVQGIEQGLNQEGAMQLQGDGVTSTLVITNMDPETLAVAESMYLARRGTSFQQRLRDAVPDAEQRAALDAYFRGGRVAAVTQRIQSMATHETSVENSNLIRMWLERLTPAEVEQISSALQEREPPQNLNTLLEAIGGEHLAQWTSAHRAGDLALRDAVQMHMILNAETVDADAFGQFVQTIGNDRFREALTRYQSEYNQSAEDIANSMPVRHRELARAYMTGNQEIIQREIIYIGLGLRGGQTSPAELQRMNALLSQLGPQRRAEILTQARAYAEEHYDVILAAQYRHEMSRPSNGTQALQNIVLASSVSDPDHLDDANRREFFLAHRDRVLSLFNQPVNGQDMAQYLAVQQMIMQRQAQYSNVQHELSTARDLNRDRASGQWRMVRDTNEEIDDWHLSASIPGWSWATGSGQLYDSLVARRSMLRNHARQYDTLVRNLGVAEDRADDIVDEAREAELEALQLMWQGQHQQAQQQMAISNTQVGNLTNLLESDIARTSPNYAAMMNDLRQDSARFQQVINHCNQAERYIGYARTGLAIVGGGAVMLVTGGAAAPVVAALYVTAAMAPGELIQAGLEIHNGRDPGNALLRAGGRSGMNFLNAWGGASGVRAVSTISRATGTTIFTNTAGREVSRQVVMRQSTINFLGMNFRRQVMTQAGRQALANPVFNQGARSIFSTTVSQGIGWGAPMVVAAPSLSVWQINSNTPGSTRPDEPVELQDESQQPRPGVSIEREGIEIEGVPREEEGDPERPQLPVEFRQFEGEIDVNLEPVSEEVPIEERNNGPEEGHDSAPTSTEPEADSQTVIPIEQRQQPDDLEPRPTLVENEPTESLPESTPDTGTPPVEERNEPVHESTSNLRPRPSDRRDNHRPGDGEGGDEGGSGDDGGVSGGGVQDDPNGPGDGDPPNDPPEEPPKEPPRDPSDTSRDPPPRRRVRQPRRSDPDETVIPQQPIQPQVIQAETPNDGDGGEENQNEGPPEYYGPTLEMMEHQRQLQESTQLKDSMPSLEDLTDASLSLGSRNHFLDSLHEVEGQDVSLAQKQQAHLQNAAWVKQSGVRSPATMDFMSTADKEVKKDTQSNAESSVESVRNTHQQLMQFAEATVQSERQSLSQQQGVHQTRGQTQGVSIAEGNSQERVQQQSQSVQKIQSQQHQESKKNKQKASESMGSVQMNRVPKEQAERETLQQRDQERTSITQGNTKSQQAQHQQSESLSQGKGVAQQDVRGQNLRQDSAQVEATGRGKESKRQQSTSTAKEVFEATTNLKSKSQDVAKEQVVTKESQQDVSSKTGVLSSAATSSEQEIQQQNGVQSVTASSEDGVRSSNASSASSDEVNQQGKMGIGRGSEKVASDLRTSSKQFKQSGRSSRDTTTESVEVSLDFKSKEDSVPRSGVDHTRNQESVILDSAGSAVDIREASEQEDLNSESIEVSAGAQESSKEHANPDTQLGQEEQAGLQQSHDREIDRPLDYNERSIESSTRPPSSQQSSRLKERQRDVRQSLQRFYNELERIQSVIGLKAPELAQSVFTAWAVERGIPARELAKVLRDSRRTERTSNTPSRAQGRRRSERMNAGEEQGSWGSFLDVLEDILVDTDSSPGRSTADDGGKNTTARKGSSVERDAIETRVDVEEKGKPKKLVRRLKKRGRRARNRIRKKRAVRQEQLSELILMQLIDLLRSKSKREQLSLELLLQMLGHFDPALVQQLKKQGLLEALQAKEDTETLEEVARMLQHETTAETHSETKQEVQKISRAELLQKLRATTAVTKKLEQRRFRTQEIQEVTRADVLRSVRSNEDGPRLKESNHEEKESPVTLQDRYEEFRGRKERGEDISKDSHEIKRRSKADLLRRLRSSAGKSGTSETSTTSSQKKRSRADLLRELKKPR